MTEETIAAVYDTAAHADAAVRDLKAAQVPADAISVHAQGATAGSTTATAAREPGFWASLFGGESTDSTVYDRSLEGGSTVVTVRTPEQHVTRVSEILERHNPIDLDERAASYGTARTTTTTTTAMPAMAATKAAMPVGTETDGGTIQLAAEQLTVGKRAVNRGTTRVRRYVVETPVEENVTLHSERVSVERRPVTGDARVTDADFTDKTIEVTETEEEAVVGKIARVTEEVVVRKDVADRVETVRDTVRREDVEITKDGTVETATGRTTETGPVTGTVPPVRR